MDEAVNELVGFFKIFMFLSARITGTFLIAPIMNQQFITGAGRNVVIISFTLIMAPIAWKMQFPPDFGMLELIVLGMKEMFLGVVMGMIVGAVFWTASSAGAFIDSQRGASMGQLFDPMSGDTSTALGSFFGQLAGAIFYVGGGLSIVLGLIYKSYQYWPVFDFFPTLPPGFLIAVQELASSIVRDAVLLAAPVGIALFLCEFGLGMINRFAQQLNVFSLSMAVKSGMAAFVLTLYISTIVVVLGQIMKRHFGEMELFYKLLQ